jgi:hypothetical protein
MASKEGVSKPQVVLCQRRGHNLNRTGMAHRSVLVVYLSRHGKKAVINWMPMIMTETNQEMTMTARIHMAMQEEITMTWMISDSAIG